MGIQHHHNHERPDGGCSLCPLRRWSSDAATIYKPWALLARSHLDRGASLPQIVALFRHAGQDDTGIRLELWRRWGRDDLPRYKAALRVLNAVRHDERLVWNPDDCTAVVTAGDGALVELSPLLVRLLVP